MSALYKLMSGTAGGISAVAASTQGAPVGNTPGTAAAIAEVNKWTMPTKITPIKAANWGSAVDAAGNVWPAVYKGLAEGQIEIEGQYDVTASTGSAAKIVMGNYYYLNLFIDRFTPFGHRNVYCLCTGFTPDVNVENQMSKFTASFEISSDTGGASVPTAPN